MDPVVLETLQKNVEGVVQNSVEIVKAVLQETEANVRDTVNTAREEMIVRIHNQHRNHEEDMRTLYNQMMVLQQEIGRPFVSPHAPPSHQAYD